MLQFLKVVTACTLILFRCTRLVGTTPQIFSEVYTFCSFEFGGVKKLTFPNKVWSIEKTDFTINFSLCKPSNHTCGTDSISCLKLKKSNDVINLGSSFIPSDSNDFTLISINGTKCPSNPSKNYTIIISLQCSDLIQPIMAADDEDECTFNITMMTPDCEPKCTELIQGAYLLDIRSFPKNVQLIQSNLKNFSLTLCGSNSNCGPGVSACEIINDSITPLARIGSQHLVYDINRNELTARGRYKNERIVRDVEILIKCKWNTDLGNAIYRKFQVQSRRYRFEIESSFGCVKLPHNCVLSSMDNLNYNLSRLHKESGWQVTGITEGQILVNICGPLNQLGSICRDQHSQVCQINKTNYTNWGSILSSLKTHNDGITATFVSGSTCQENSTLLYSTQIEFICSEIEKGPIFKEHKWCLMFLTWETPHACPVDYYTSSNCYMSDRVSHRNLQKLHTESDKMYTLFPDVKTKLVYNLCGPIHTSCNNFTNVSFCLKTEYSETVIAWESKHLISDNGLLRMELEGVLCSQNGKGKVTVNFVCTYENPPPSTQVNVIEDGCRYNLTVYTVLSCLSHAGFLDCVHKTDNLTYNLSSLVYKNKNYVVQSGQNVDYIFNLCGPIVSGPQVLCRGDTMFCLRNKSEINIKHRFTSLGGLGKPRFSNGGLVIEAEMGAYCQNLGHYKSVIHFKCSKTKSSPVFVSNEDCIFNFKWETPEACPVEKKCIINGTEPDTTLDLTNLQSKHLQFNIDNSTAQYEVNLCQDIYMVYGKDTKNIHPLKREFFTFRGNIFVVLDFQKKCNRSTVSKIIFKMECSQLRDDYIDERSVENCILNVTLHSKVVCRSEKETYVVAEPAISKERNKTEIVTLYPRKIAKNCTLLNGNTGYEFNLNKMQSEELFFGNDIFFVNFDNRRMECQAVFCKNSRKLIIDTCPIVSFNYRSDYLKLKYTSEDKCDTNNFYVLEILLKCNQSRVGGKIIKNEACETIIKYNLPEACDLLKENGVPTAPIAAIISSVVAVLVIFVIIGLIYLNRKRCHDFRYYIAFRNDKSNVPIYRRNCSE